MKIPHKLIGSFVGISLLTGVVGIVSIAQTQKVAESLAIAEAEHVAQVLATSISHGSNHHRESISTEYSAELQHFTTLLHNLQQRDIVIVNREKLILADVVPENVGTLFEHDAKNEIQQTMQDGQPRTFLETSVDYPQGIKLIAVPLTNDDGQKNGAVILEWASIYDAAIAHTRPTMIVIALTSLGCILLALLVGLRISHGISKPLQWVTTVANQVTHESNFNLRVPVLNHDEIGTLATAFNHLIQRVEILLSEKEQHSDQLQQAVTQLHCTLDELHRTQAQMVHSEKMSSLGQMVAGVAHEINNPVNFIHGNLSHLHTYTQDLLNLIDSYQTYCPNPPIALQEKLEDADLPFLTEDLAKILQSMQIGTERIRQIVLSLRNFARLDEATMKDVNIHDGLDSTLVILGYRLKSYADHSEIQVIKDYGQLPKIECYAGQLNQVFMNILTNAIDALEDANTKRPLQDIQANPSQITIRTAVVQSNWVRITIADNGFGIPAQIQQRLFEPFFTTKPVGKGTGMGLFISYQIITENHHGKLYCQSSAGAGSEFVIEIPIQKQGCQTPQSRLESIFSPRSLAHAARPVMG